jgi:phage shock protein B
VEDVLVPALAIAALFIGLPWLVLHYATQWRRARGLSIEDERLLDEMHDLARRLDDRLQTIERIVAADNPNWRAHEAATRPLPPEARWPGRA